MGGIGIAPGANINYLTGHAIFEATHGTAPKYANQDKVNPGSVILSGEMMFRYLGWDEAADLIIRSLEKTIAQKRVTYDFERLMAGATLLTCSGFGKAMVENMGIGHFLRLRQQPLGEVHPLGELGHFMSAPSSSSSTSALIRSPDSITSGSHRRTSRPSESRNWPAPTRMQSPGTSPEAAEGAGHQDPGIDLPHVEPMGAEDAEEHRRGRGRLRGTCRTISELGMALVDS